MVNVQGVGKQYAKFVDYLVLNGVKGRNIHLIGHSLGAHVSGFAAKYARDNVKRVTGKKCRSWTFSAHFML